jgi:hypothetical protein
VELTLEGRTVVGHITSAAELTLSAGTRVFALGMIRAEAEVGNEPFKYVTGTSEGTARILAAPPSFE